MAFIGNRNPKNTDKGSTTRTTWLLSDLLQSLGEKNKENKFYIDKSNQLVQLFKDFPEIIQDLELGILGHRIQLLLLSESSEVIACGYRIARYAIQDVNALRKLVRGIDLMDVSNTNKLGNLNTVTGSNIRNNANSEADTNASACVNTSMVDSNIIMDAGINTNIDSKNFNAEWLTNINSNIANNTKHDNYGNTLHDDNLISEINSCSSLVDHAGLFHNDYNKAIQEDNQIGNNTSPVHKVYDDLNKHTTSDDFGATTNIASTEETLSSTVSNSGGLRIHFFIISSLMKSKEFTLEREQALKLVRHYIDIPNGVFELSLALAKTLVALVDINGEDEDSLSDVISETLCELLLVYPQLIYEANGMKPIMRIIFDGSPYLACMYCMVIIRILDNPQNRKFLRNGEELGQIVYYFVNNFNNLPDKNSAIVIPGDKTKKSTRPHVNIEKLHNSAFILSSFLKTWPGLIAFSVNNFEILKTLISSLSYDIPALRDILMDIFFDVLKIRTLPWLNLNSNTALINSNYKRFSQMNSNTKNYTNNRTLSTNIYNGSKKTFIINHYAALLLNIFLKCGLVEQVINIINVSKDEINRRKATFLLTELYQYSVQLLPIKQWQAHFEFSVNQNCSRPFQTAVFQVDKMTEKLHKNKTTFNISNDIFKPYETYNKNIISIINSSIDDVQLRKMIEDTKVLLTKKFVDWKWDIILELIKGPLRNPLVFEDLLKTQYKFLKKILSFFRPFKRKFIVLKRSKDSQKYVNTGVELFETLMSHKEGITFFSSNKILPQIAECLSQIDENSGFVTENPIFSIKNLKNTLSAGYFKMLGVLSKSTIGLSLLQKWKFFTLLMNIIHLNKRDDLILLLLREFDYNISSPLRVIFGFTLTTAVSKSVRVLLTEHLSVVLSNSQSQSCSRWAFNMLISQLYDRNISVCDIAVRILDTYCVDPINITEVVKYKPTLDQLGDVGAPLMLRFLSTSIGFDYLLELNIIDREIDEWYVSKNDLYVFEIENYLHEEYSPFRLNNKTTITSSNTLFNDTAAVQQMLDDSNRNKEEDKEINSKRIFPHHFYGELAKTQSGIALLQQSGHFEEFVSTIRELSLLEITEFHLLKLKSCLWAVGHIGSSQLATNMLNDSGITELIIEIFKSHPVWSVKGTAFFVLGLLSSTDEGLEILDEFEWDVSLDADGNPTSFCIPNSIETYINVERVPIDSLMEARILGSSSLMKQMDKSRNDENKALDTELNKSFSKAHSKGGADEEMQKDYKDTSIPNHSMGVDYTDDSTYDMEISEGGIYNSHNKLNEGNVDPVNTNNEVINEDFVNDVNHNNHSKDTTIEKDGSKFHVSSEKIKNLEMSANLGLMMSSNNIDISRLLLKYNPFFTTKRSVFTDKALYNDLEPTDYKSTVTESVEDNAKFNEYSTIDSDMSVDDEKKDGAIHIDQYEGNMKDSYIQERLIPVIKDAPEFQRLEDSIDIRIIYHIRNMVLKPKNSMRLLLKLEANNKERFNNPDLFLNAMGMLESYSYKANSIRFIISLFANKKALEGLIKRDRLIQKRLKKEETF